MNHPGPSSRVRRPRTGGRPACWALAGLWLALALPERACAQAPARATEVFEEGAFWRGDIRVEADRLQYLESEGLLRLDGHVSVSGGGGQLRSDHAEVWMTEKRVRFFGRVRLIQGRQVIRAEQIVLDRERAEQSFFLATLMVKERAASVECAEDRGEAPCGLNTLVIQCGKIVRRPKESLLWAARFTPCDCGADEAPTFEIGASRAELEPGEGAWLSWPVFYAKGVPILGLPGVYLPLSERRSGFLFPQANYSGRDGVVLSDSLFLTLGRSADATLSLDWFEERGMRERVELRAAPAAGAWTRAEFSHISDRKHPVFGRRFSLEAEATARGPLALAADVHLFSDSDQSRDFATDLAGRSAEEAPSRLRLAWECAAYGLEADVAYHQDLRTPGLDLFSADAADTIHRLGGVTFRWRPVLAAVPFAGLDVVAEAANYSSLGYSVRDFGLDGTAGSGDAGEADGLVSFGEVRRALRLRAEPTLSVAGGGRVLRFAGRLSHRQLVYLPHGTGSPGPATRGLSRVELELFSEVSRSYGEGNAALGHVLQPRVSLVGIWPGAEAGGFRTYFDELDRLDRQVAQVLAGIDSDLYSRESFGWARRLRLALRQAVDVERRRIGQSLAYLRLDQAPWEASGWLSFAPERARLCEVELGAAVMDRRGDRLRLGYRYLPVFAQQDGSRWILAERMNREEGLLIGLAPNAWRVSSGEVHFLEGQGTVALGAGVALSALANLDLAGGHLIGAGGGVSYRSPCHCLVASLDVRLVRGQSYPDVFFLLDMMMLGSAGGGTAQRF